MFGRLVFGELEYDKTVEYGKLIITNVAPYLPPNEADPIVLNAAHDKSEPKFRAYITDKAAAGGSVFYVPDSSDALMTAIDFADAGRFTVVAK